MVRVSNFGPLDSARDSIQIIGPAIEDLIGWFKSLAPALIKSCINIFITHNIITKGYM